MVPQPMTIYLNVKKDLRGVESQQASGALSMNNTIASVSEIEPWYRYSVRGNKNICEKVPKWEKSILIGPPHGILAHKHSAADL